MNLAKLPASTIQLLGAEKALFKSLKNKTKTPKYGLIFNSQFITKSKQYYKGKISRYLANKAAIAIRVDYFGNTHSKLYGEAYKKQILNKIKMFDEKDKK
jgi:nucleolar protein 56